MTTTNAIQKLIKGCRSVPTLPEVVLRIQAMVDDPTTGAAEIGAVVVEDAPLAAKVLRIANSAYYGLSGRCMSTERATTVLGVKMLRNIVTQVAVFEAFEHLEKEWGSDLHELWNHAMRTAQVCGHIASRSRRLEAVGAPECHACGLLHDIGKFVMLDGLGSEYMETVSAARGKGTAQHLEERMRFGFDHAEVGLVLSTRWGLPEVMARAIRYHHGPRDRIAQDAVVAVVAKSDQAVHRAAEGDEPGIRSIFDEATSKQLGLDPDDVDEIVQFLLTPGVEPEEEGWHSDSW
jgi:putative nucleotidyltransferase with HDIG domain